MRQTTILSLLLTAVALPGIAQEVPTLAWDTGLAIAVDDSAGEMPNDYWDVGCCCPCCCPTWTANVGYVHFWRERTGSDFAVWENTAETPVLTADRFNFDSSAIDGSIAWNNGCGLGLELRYLGVVESSTRITDTFAPPDTRPATNPNTSIGFGPTPLDFAYESDLQSVEVLGQLRYGFAKFTLGFRSVDLDEILSVDSVGNPAILQFQTQNKLYGGQVGLEGLIWENCRGLQISGLAKAGLYYNDAAGASTFTFFGATSRIGEERSAFVGEFGLTASYEVSHNLSVQLGYQLMFVDGLSLASDLVPNTGNMNTPPFPVANDSSSLLYHGLALMLEGRW